MTANIIQIREPGYVDGETIVGDGSASNPVRAIATGAASGAAAVPARSVFVSQAWPANADPSVFFTSIGAALTQAATLAPVQTAQVLVKVFPGVYVEDVTIPSWVILVGDNQNATVIDGTLTWTPTAAGGEAINIVGMRVDVGLVVDTTGKPSGGSTINATNCNFADVNHLGRTAVGGNRDLFYLGLCNFGGGAFVCENVLLEVIACRHRGFTLNGACRYTVSGGNPIPQGAAIPWDINGTSTGVAVGTSFISEWNFAAGTSGVFAGCQSTANVNIAAGATVDARAANLDGLLVGPGAANRTAETFSFGPTVPGPNLVAFAVPFADAAYNVSLQLTAGPGNAAATVTAKTASGFTLTDAVGVNTFDITVVHD